MINSQSYDFDYNKPNKLPQNTSLNERGKKFITEVPVTSCVRISKK